jgi:hypothetical protein
MLSLFTDVNCVNHVLKYINSEHLLGIRISISVEKKRDPQRILHDAPIVSWTMRTVLSICVHDGNRAVMLMF